MKNGRSKTKLLYPSDYIQDEETNKERFRTEIPIPAPQKGEKVKKIRLHASTFYSYGLMKWTGEGHAEVEIQ